MLYPPGTRLDFHSDFKNNRHAASIIKNEKYLPIGCSSLWNDEGKKINFRSLELGAKLDKLYDQAYNTAKEVKNNFREEDKEFFNYFEEFFFWFKNVIAWAMRTFTFPI